MRHIPDSLAARIGLVLLALLSLQALLTGVLVSTWLSRRDLAMHQVELREQAGLLLPAVMDSLVRWAGSGPLISRQAELRHRMNLSLGKPRVMSLVWLDESGNMAAAGFLAEDPRLPDLKQLAMSGLSPRVLEDWAASRKLALVAQPTAQGWLLLAGSSAEGLWHLANKWLLAAILAGSAAIAGMAAWLLVQPLLRRFHRFHLAIASLGAGEMGSRLHDWHADELGQLARAFNHMAERLQGLTDQLESSDQRRRRLVSEVSHELGAPLTTIIGHLDLLQRRELDEESRRMIRLCLAQSHRLDTLVMDLLDLARLDEAGLRLRRVPCDLRDTMEQEIAAIELACLDRSISLEWTVPVEPVLVEGDEARLSQVLRNILRNAVHQLGTMAEGNARLLVELEALAGHVLLRVTDNGPGIRGEDLALLFDRYFRPHSQVEEGSGLGLCISRRLAELHGGTLTAQSDGLGRGATFTLRLPAVPEEQAQF